MIYSIKLLTLIVLLASQVQLDAFRIPRVVGVRVLATRNLNDKRLFQSATTSLTESNEKVDSITVTNSDTTQKDEKNDDENVKIDAKEDATANSNDVVEKPYYKKTDVTTNNNPDSAVKSGKNSSTNSNTDTTTYLMCSACKTAYLMTARDLGPRGSRVQCSVCGKEWFQTVDRLLTLTELTTIEPMTQEKIDDVKRILADSNFPRHPRADKVGIFVGNLPYTYDEKQIEELFQEYGITNISLVKDPEGLSKGFAFLEVNYCSLMYIYLLPITKSLVT